MLYSHDRLAERPVVSLDETATAKVVDAGTVGAPRLRELTARCTWTILNRTRSEDERQRQARSWPAKRGAGTRCFDLDKKEELQQHKALREANRRRPGGCAG